MKKRGLLALAISAALIATTLAGCGSGGGSEQTTAAAGTTAAAAAGGTAETTAAAEETTQAVAPEDMPTIVMFNNSDLVTNNPNNQLGSDTESYEMVQKYIMDSIGVKVEVIIPPANSGDEKQKLSTLLAGGDQLDIWWGDWHDYYQDGIIIPINEYLDEPWMKGVKEPWDAANGWLNVTDMDGNIWGIPRMVHSAGNPIFVRNDWLDQLGMEMPTTFDELNAYLYAVKELDPYGNGETIPLLIQGTSVDAAMLAGYTKYGTGRFLDETDGKVKPDYLADGYLDYVRQLNQWYKDGIIHPEFMSHNKNDVMDLVMSGRAAATACWYSRITNAEATTRKVVNLDTSKYDYTYGWSDTGVIGPNGQYMQSEYLGNNQTQMISSKCKNPEAALKFISWAYEPENQRILKNGIEGVHWEWDPDVENAQEVGAVKKIDGSLSYCRDFDVAVGARVESREITYYDDGVRNVHNLWLGGPLQDKSITVYNQLEGEFQFDKAAIKENAPMADANTYYKEEYSKFITGKNPLDQWDNFIQNMYSLGLDAYIEECTRQYNEAQK